MNIRFADKKTELKLLFFEFEKQTILYGNIEPWIYDKCGHQMANLPVNKRNNKIQSLKQKKGFHIVSRLILWNDNGCLGENYLDEKD